MNNRLVDETGKASNTRRLSVESFWVSVAVTVAGLVFAWFERKAAVQFAEWAIVAYLGGSVGTAITARLTASRKGASHGAETSAVVRKTDSVG